MKLKNILPMSLICAASIIATSCSNDAPVQTEIIPYSVMNLISPYGDTPTFAQEGAYKVEYQQSEGKLIISAGNLLIDNQSLSFSTSETPYTITAGNNNTTIFAAHPLNCNLTGIANKTVDNISFKLGNGTHYFYNEEYEVPGFPAPVNVKPTFLLKYNISDLAQVCTFADDEYFYGETTTSYRLPQSTEQKNYTTPSIIYRAIMDCKNNKASIIIYKATFASGMPEIKAMLLDNLKIEYFFGGYKIIGENIVPSVAGDGGLTPYPRFMFDNIELTTISADLSQVNIKYTVAGAYKGEFTGSYFTM